MANIQGLNGSDKLREAYPKINNSLAAINNELLAKDISGAAALALKADKTVVEELAGAGRTIETVKGVSDNLGQLASDYTTQRSLDIANNTEPKLPSGHTKRVQGYGMLSLPSNAKGQFSDVKLLGNTATNIIINGSFETDLSGWAVDGSNALSISSNHAFVGSKSCKQSATGCDSYRNIVGIPSGHKVYYAGWVYIVSPGEGARLSLADYDARSNLIYVGADIAKLNQWQRLSVIKTLISDGVRVWFGQYGVGAASEIYYDGLMSIDLTATFGAGNEPTQAQCDVLFSNWFDGTKSTLSEKVTVKDNLGNITSVAYTPAIGGSIPNGVKDEFNVSTRVKAQRISSKVLVAGDVTSMWVDAVNVDIAFINKPIDYIYYNTGGSVLGSLTLDGISDIVFSDNVSNIGFVYGADATRLGYMVAKGTTLTTVQTTLAGKTLNYQLAVPVVTQLDPICELVAYPNGTIYAEPCISGYMKEATKVITTVSVPISTINNVTRYDISDTGRFIKIDVTANVTMDAGKTTLTIANFIAGKTYFYDCSYPPELSTQPELILDAEVNNGTVENDYLTAAVDWVLSSNESKATMLVCKNAGGASKIIAPADMMYVVRNISGQTITIKTSTSTGITVATAKTATMIYYGTDYIKISEI